MGFQGGSDDAYDDGLTTTTEYGPATFVVRIFDETIGSNKTMISLMNAVGSGVTVKIKSIKIINSRNTAVTGVVGDFRLFRITDHSAGTLLTPLSHDTNDVLNANVTARTPASISGVAATAMYRWEWSTDEWSFNALDVEANDHVGQTLMYAYKQEPSTKPITLRAGQGIALNQIVNSTAGTFDVEIIFTQE